MDAATSQPTRVFISYSRVDSTAINRLEAELIGYGFRTWLDREHIEGGNKWASQIERAIQESDVVIAGLSPDAISSPWVIKELHFTENMGKPIIPVLIRPVERILLLLADLHYIDLCSDEPLGLQQLRLRLLQIDKQINVVRLPHPVLPPVDLDNGNTVPLPPLPPSPDPSDMFLQAVKAHAHGDLDQAEALLRQIVERDPHFGNDIALQQLENILLKLLPHQLERLQRQARQAEARGAWDEAIDAWQAFLKKSPDNTEATSALNRDDLNRSCAWLYAHAQTLAQQKDWPAFMQMWQLLKDRAPAYGDPDGLLESWVPGALLVTCDDQHSLVNGVVWSPDGKYIATASDDKTVKLWEAATGHLLRTCADHTSSVFDIAWSLDGNYIASASGDKTLRIWDAATGQALQTFEGHAKSVWGVAWSPDGQRVASVSLDKTMRIWDATTGQSLMTFNGHTNAVYGVAWSPDGTRLTTASGDKTVRIWDALTGECLRIFESHSDPVRDVAWASDGKLIASASEDESALIWEAGTGRMSAKCEGHTNAVYGVAWSPDGQRLATASLDKTVRLWDAMSGQLQLIINEHSRSVYTVSWSPDGQQVASASEDGTVRIWRV